uniref:Gypsy retrotransposon integrase-like protein 1 n=1 Tax=Latimeria chalumnae TaxID=7897 RepID=H3AIA3_LATCH
ILAQVQDNLECVIAYASHVLTKAERKWSTYGRELWATVWAVRHFRHYLCKQPFTIVTDHKPLLGLNNDHTGRRARWALELDPYDWVDVHREGQNHLNADALSRRPSEITMEDSVSTTIPAVALIPNNGVAKNETPHHVSGCTTEQPHTPNHSSTDIPDSADNTSPPKEKLNDLSPPLVFALSNEGHDLSVHQQQDPILAVVRKWKIVVGRRPPHWHMKVYHKASKEPIYQVLVPQKLVDRVLWFLHGNATSGHMAAKKTLRRAHQLCYWPFMSRDIHAWCEKCHSCQARRTPVPRPQAPMKSIVADKPFQEVAADILELPITSCGNHYVLVVQDYFTKYVNLFALPDQRAMTVAKCLFENYIREHGVPESLHTDQGRQFESDVVKHLCQLLGIRKTRTSPYHPQSDGMVEQFNRTLIDQLSKTPLEHSGEWDDYLNQVVLAYNTSTHSSTGFTPFFLIHG